MARRGASTVLLLAVAGWAIFGSWALWSNEGVGHAVAFFFFSVCLLGLAVHLFGAPRGLLPTALLLVAIAGASEYLQPRFTSRPAEWADVTSDLIGVGVGFVVVSAIAAAFRKAVWPWIVVGCLCLAALGGSLALAWTGSTSIEERIENRFECWGEGLDPVPDVAGGPIIHVEGDAVRLGADARPLGDGVISNDSGDLRCSVLRSGSYSIVATVTPASIETGGPMRIFTSSKSTRFDEENTHLGQEFDMLSVRISSENGLQWESVADVFVPGERVTVAMVVTDGQVNVFVEGEWRAEFVLEGDSFAEWDEDFPILIGDEFTRDRTYEGEIEVVSFFDRALTEGDPLLVSADR